MSRKFWGGNNTIDNVPMRFSDKYLALQHSFPSIDDRDGEDFQRFNVSDYKFTAELEALEMYELSQKRKVEEEARKAKLNEEWELHEQKKQEEETRINGEPVPTTQSSGNVFYNVLSGEILQPQPLEHKFAKDLPMMSGNKNRVLNPREFESEGTNPFDNVELQSIDDRKELNQLFQTLNITSNGNDSHKSQNDDNSESRATRANLGVVSSMASPQTQQYSNQVGYSYYNAPNVASGYMYSSYGSPVRLSMPQAYGSRYYDSQQQQQQQPSTSSGFAAFTQTTPQVYAPSSSTMAYPYQQDFTGHTQPSSSLQFQPMEMMKRSSSEDRKNLAPNDSETFGQHFYSGTPASTNLRSSKSVSDLTNLNNGEASPLNVKNLGTNGFSGSNNYIPNTRASINVTMPASNPNNSLPDPYDTLTVEERKFVDYLDQMGFHRDRVSRAVKHIGIDERRLFDHLLALQQLEDEGFHCYESEIALHMNNYNKHKAKEFLISLREICELGYDKDTAIKALFKSNNEKAKAIEALTSNRRLV